MSNVYLCIYDYHLIKELIEYGTSQRDINVVGIATAIHEDIEKLVELKTDVLVLQFGDDKLSATRLLSNIYEDERLRNMQILILFRELDMDTIHMLLQYDIKNFLMEPYTVRQLIDAILQEGSRKNEEDASHWNMDAFSSKVLHDLGIPMHLDGYGYLKTCSMITFQLTPKNHLVIGNVYQECAKHHTTTATRVEKAIRTAVNYAFRTQPEKICIYNSKPTNSQIILYISEKLKLYNLL